MLSADDLQNMKYMMSFWNKHFLLSTLIVLSEVVDFWWKADPIVDWENNVKCRESNLPVGSYTDPTRILVWVFAVDWLLLGVQAHR